MAQTHLFTRRRFSIGRTAFAILPSGWTVDGKAVTEKGFLRAYKSAVAQRNRTARKGR